MKEKSPHICITYMEGGKNMNIDNIECIMLIYEN